MKTIKQNLMLSVVIFVVSFAATAYGIETPVSLDEFIIGACKEDKEFEVILIDELGLAYQKALGLPARDFVLSLKSEYNLFVETEKEEPEYDISLSKLFPSTGTEVSGGYVTTSNNDRGSVSSEYSIKISQPVARNAFGYATRLLDKIIGLEVDVAGYQIIEAYETYLASIVLLYYDWYESYENLKTAENSYNENVKLLENVKKREKDNIALPVDVNKVKIQVMTKQEDLVELRSKHKENANLLRKSLGLTEDVQIIPGMGDKFEGTEIDLKSDYAKFRETSRTTRILDMLEKKSKLEVNKYANQLLPSVDIYGEFDVTATDRYMEKDDKKAFMGISIEYPFPGEVERAELEVSKISSRKQALSNENTHDIIYVRLRNIDEEIQKEKELIKIADEKINVAEAIVNDDTINYSYGKIVLNNFIDEVNRLDQARFNKIQHTIKLKKLIIEWLALTDTLVVNVH
ncbi:MAG: TolC family protein [Candidatus Omnitrophica bacterium]|nr:TolC family protein [Candidatus Omnitrophota bacterium]